MIYREPRGDEISLFDKVSNHPLQSWAWGEFRKQTGVEVVRVMKFDQANFKASMQFTFHPIPKLPYTVGYFPKSDQLDESDLETIKQIAKEHKAIFVKLEPNMSVPPKTNQEMKQYQQFLKQRGCVPGRKLFTPYSFILDLTKSEDELLKGMKSKTRYNVRLAEKKGVKVVEDSSPESFEEYLALLRQTTKRQQFYSHDETYHRNMWQHLSQAGIAKILRAEYQGKTLVAWIVFVFNNTLYYPYGASSREYREVMASNLIMWEAIKYGKEQGCTSFDMWGALGPEPDRKDPWYGFHKFKLGYGGELAHFLGTYDLVVDPILYRPYQMLDAWRWKYLRLRKKLGL